MSEHYREIGVSGVGIVGQSETSVWAPAWLHRLARRPRARSLLRRLGFVCQHQPVAGYMAIGVIPGVTPGWPVNVHTGALLDLAPHQRRILAKRPLAGPGFS